MADPGPPVDPDPYMTTMPTLRGAAASLMRAEVEKKSSHRRSFSIWILGPPFPVSLSFVLPPPTSAAHTRHYGRPALHIRAVTRARAFPIRSGCTLTPCVLRITSSYTT